MTSSFFSTNPTSIQTDDLETLLNRANSLANGIVETTTAEADRAVEAAKRAAQDAQQVATVNSQVSQNLSASMQQAAQAKLSADAAVAAQGAAAGSATTAGTKATEASSSATQAATAKTAAEAASAQAVTSATAAGNSNDAAGVSAAAALTSETNAKASETNAKVSETNAKTSETNAKASETNSKTSETNAKASENASKLSENASKTSETNAKTSETNAKTSETNAKTSETNAAGSASTATTKAAEAVQSANDALASKIAAALSETNAKTSETNVASTVSTAIANILAANQEYFNTLMATFQNETYQSVTPTGTTLPYGLTTLERDAEGFYSLNNWIDPANRAQSKLSRYDVTYDAADALRTALASGLDIAIPEGNFLIGSGGATMTKAGQRLKGAGRTKTTLFMRESFTQSTGDIINLNHNCEIEDIGFWCNQQDAAPSNDVSKGLTRSTITAYPWMINLTSKERCRVRRIRINQATYGILANGNTGGLDTDCLEIGAFIYGLLVDGAYDFVSLRGTHFWPFGCANRADLLALSHDGITVGLEMGRVESFDIQGLKSFGAVIVQRAAADGGLPFGTMSGVSLDGNGASFNISAGRAAIAGLYSTKNGTSQFAINQTGGRLVLTGADFDHNSDIAPLFNNGGDQIVSGSHIKVYNPNCQHVINYTGSTVLLGNHFDYAGGAQVRGTPMVLETGSGVIRGNANSFRRKEAGASGQGALFAISNAGSVWANNDMGGWQVDVAPGGAKVTNNT